ncbi:type IIG restriction enzyme/methyltransferase [Helicobacter winghamensis]|uniref:type IIG restriction enzyme/methyltransferase n=1 Tax=Helicobacter winghamensis TaxID=157268 RepID=UPI0027A52AC8
MKLSKLIFEKESLEENLNPLYYKQNIEQEEFEAFKDSILEYLAKIHNHKDTKAETWLVSNALLPFLENVGFKGCVEAQYHQNKQNQNSTIDLALANENVEVIFEAKKPDNRSEMFSVQNTTAKAMCEAILYYIRERENGNVDLKFVILTDFFNFYIFKAKEFEKLFYKNPHIKKIYNNKNLISNNKDFYDELERLLHSEKFFSGITPPKDDDKGLWGKFLYGLHIDLRLFENDSKKHKNIFKVFHRDYLLAEYRPDSNRINQRFFDELLFALGLKQDSKTNKIEIDTEQNTSFIKIIQAKLAEKLGDSTELFDQSMELLIIWLNRILFLKLIETNLSHFNSENGFQSFLTKEKITDFKTLEHLFFEVLAKDYATRKEDKGFNYIPYLNSSLFLKKELESHLNISIKDIDNFHITPYSNTQVRDINTHKKITNKLPFLEYLFDFLNAFDFGKDFEKHPKSKQDKQTQEAQEKGEISDSDNAMDSRILGLVFENLNGFKEGSFYTPGFITEYMCKESLEKIILEKFNKLFSANAQDLENARELLRLELKSGNTQAKAKLKEALLSIRVCDPSVGSGHFLASALNYLCYYFDYFTLSDLENINLSVENDTLKQGFHYKRPRDEKEQTHKNQKALFELKKQIIESCLFGVDINPISCEIARLRLWIELLKNSYYTEFKSDPSIHKLETLPNIDINIKCGNSLISRFDLQEYDEHNKPKIHTLAWLTNNNTNFANNFKEQIKNYKQQVNLYKNALGNKKDIADKIEVIKTLFRNHLVMVSPIATELESNLCKFVQKYGDETFDIETPFGMEMIKIIRKKNQEQKGFRFQPTLENPNPSPIDKKANDLLQTIKKDYEALESLKEDSFEWRFAFPEVLDSNGDFLGFDLVIGNPPYIRQEEIKHLKPQLQKAFRIYKGTSDIYTYFYEQGHKILKHNGILSFITSNKYCRAGYGEPLREFLLEATALLYYIELNGIKVFDSASVDTSILSFIKTTPDSKHTFDFAHPKDYDTKANAPLQEYITPQSLLQSSLTKESFIFQDSTNAALKAKIEAIGTPLKKWDISINYGIKTGYNEAFIIDSHKRDEILSNCGNDDERQRTSELIKPILRGRDIKRYSLWIINTHNGYTTSDSSLTQSLQELQQNASVITDKVTPSHFASQPTNLTQDTRIAKDIESSRCETSAGSRGNPQATSKIKIPPIDINDYPALKAHLDTHWDKIAKRADKGETPYNLRNCAYLEEFEKEKIVYSEIVREPQFYLDSGEFKFGNFYAEATSFILSGNENFTHSLHYLLGILHSKLITYAFKEFYAGGGLGESGYRYKKAFLERLPIPKVDSKTEAEFIQIVQEILEKKKVDSTIDTPTLESKLDNLVYQLYNLSDDEIRLVESMGGG